MGGARLHSATEFSSQKKMSHVKPQLDELDVELKGLAWSEVKQLAVQLKVEYPTLRKIEEKYNSDAEPCLLTAMQCWLDEDTTASWGKIVDALRAIDKRVLADDIQKKYSSLATPPEPQINHPQDSSAPPAASTNDGERSLTPVQQEVSLLCVIYALSSPQCPGSVLALWQC